MCETSARSNVSPTRILTETLRCLRPHSRSTPALAPLYEQRGFVRYKPACWDDAMGLQVPMALVLDDLPFLQRCDPMGAITAAINALAATPPAGFPDPAAKRWLSKVLDSRPAVLVSSCCHDVEGLHRFVDARGIDLSRMPLFSGVSDAERHLLLTECPNTLSVLDVPFGTLISRKGDVRDESFMVLRGAVDVDGGVETLTAGSVVGESAFLSGEARVCTVRVVQQLAPTAALGSAGAGGNGTGDGNGNGNGGGMGWRDEVAEGSVLLLVTSRVGFQKAMRVVPSVAIKLLWNMAIELSRKFTRRSEQLSSAAELLEAKQREVQRTQEAASQASQAAADAERKATRAVEIQQLRETAHKLRKLVATNSQPVAKAGGGARYSVSSAQLPSFQLSAASAGAAIPPWRASLDEGLEVWKRLEKRYAETKSIHRAGTGTGTGRRPLSASSTTPILPSNSSRAL